MAMKNNPLLSLVCAIALVSLTGGPSVAAAASDETPLPQPEAYQQRIIDWIRSGENGYFHPAVVWKRLGPDGESGPYALHTTRDVPKGETLLVVPRSHTIDSLKTHEHCYTVARMLKEYEKGDDSFYAPYISYLFDETAGGTSTGLMPTSWTPEGQEILEFILDYREDDALQPKDYRYDSVFDTCGRNFRSTNPHQELEDPQLRQRAEDAYCFLLSRSWQDKMIPVLDMYNHRNGPSKNVESSTVHYNDKDITAYALRDIKAGEQLQNTYSECMDDDCKWGKMQYEYLTASIFVDFGFLELYPRRWELGPVGHEVVAEVDQDLQTEDKVFKWIFDKPSSETLEWISRHLERLRSIKTELLEDISLLRSMTGKAHNNIEHEADSLLELYEGYVEILEMALEHKEDPIGVTREQFESDLDDARKSIELFYDEL